MRTQTSFIRFLKIVLLSIVMIVGTAGAATAASGWLITVMEPGKADTYHFVIDKWGRDTGAREAAYEQLCNKPGVTCRQRLDTIDQDDAPRGTDIYNEETDTFVEDNGEYGSVAMALFSYATGDSCITCDFMAYFMSGLTDFSKAVYTFFNKGFLLLTPVMLAVWIGYRVAKLVTFGGEDGRSFIASIAQKFALFAFIFTVFSTTATSTNGNDTQSPSEFYAWNMVGPNFLDYGFSLSNQLRTDVIDGINGGATDSLSCGAVKPQSTAPGVAAMVTKYPYIMKGVEISCVTERTHIIGISTGLAVIFSSWYNPGVRFYDVEAQIKGLLTGAVKIATGVLILAVYTLSAVWLIFLTLDIVVRVMITAAFAPLIGGMYLWQPTRGMAVNGIKGLFGSIMTGVALTIVSLLAFFMITNVIDVYEALLPAMKQQFADNKDYILQPIKCSTAGSNPQTCANGILQQFGEFIVRTQETNNANPRVPMNLGTPYFYYLVLAGLSIFAMEKKIISILENLLDHQGMSAMADNALSVFKTGTNAAAAGTVATAFLTKKIGGKGMQAGSFGLGAAAAAYQNGNIGGAGRFVAESWRNRGENKNVFANTDKGVLNNVLSKAGAVNVGKAAASKTIGAAVDVAEE